MSMTSALGMVALVGGIAALDLLTIAVEERRADREETTEPEVEL